MPLSPASAGNPGSAGFAGIEGGGCASPDRAMALADPTRVPRNSVRGPAQENVRNERQHCPDDQRLDRAEPAEHDELIDEIDPNREHEDPRHASPTASEKLATVHVPAKDRPEVRRATSACIPQAVPQREEYRHQWLDVEPKRQRAIGTLRKLTPKPAEYVHACPLPRA